MMEELFLGGGGMGEGVMSESRFERWGLSVDANLEFHRRLLHGLSLLLDLKR